MINTILIYFCLAIITSVLAEITSRAKFKQQGILCGIVTVFIPSFIAAIRYNTGTDYNTYLNVFNDLKSKSMVEFGYAQLNLLIKNIGGNIELIFFIMSCIMNTFILLTLLKNKSKISVGIGMFVFMLLFYPRSYNIMRQMTSASILIYSISCINEHKIIKFTLLVFLATSLHYSSIILNYLNKEHRMKERIIAFILFLLIFFNTDKIFLPIFESNEKLIYYSGYLKRKEVSSMGMGVILQYLPYILIWAVLYKEFKKDSTFLNYCIMLILGIVLETSTYFFENDAANRMALTFIMSIIIILSMCMRKFMQRKKYIIVTFIFIYVIFMWYNIYFLKGYHDVVPYNWILS